MRIRFGLRFDCVRDQGDLLELRRRIELGANPFDHVSFCLTSVDFARQKRSYRTSNGPHGTSW
jgi:hypothetical protein